MLSAAKRHSFASRLQTLMWKTQRDPFRHASARAGCAKHSAQQPLRRLPSAQRGATELKSEPRAMYGTWAALALGGVGVALANLLACYSAYIVHSSRLVFGHLPMAALIVFVFVCLPLQTLLRIVSPRWALSRAGLVLVFCMVWLGGTMPAAAFSGMFVAAIAAPYYYATPENQWAIYFIEHLPTWAVPSNENAAMQWFFEGAPKGQAIPWEVWIVPLFWWSIFFAALAAATVCIVAILRKQWVDNERLAFPLAEVPMYLSESRPAAWAPSLFKNRLFWIGAAIPLFVLTWNILGCFMPTLPTIRLGARTYIRVGRAFPRIGVKVNFFLLSFAFLTNLEVLFSIWFFYLISVLQIGVFNRTGFTIGPPDMWGSAGGAAQGWQSFGAFCMLAGLASWMARRHVMEVFAAAWRGEEGSHSEVLSPRAAVSGLVLSLAVLVAWLWRSGMSLAVAVMFVGTVLVMFIGVTRIVAESGLVYLRAPITPQSFVFYSVGLTHMAPATATSLGLSYCHFGLGNTFVMSQFAHIDRVAAALGLKGRNVLAATAFAVVIGLATSIWYTIHLGYEHGAYNFGVYTFRYGNQTIFNNLVSKMKNPFDVDWARLAFFGIGAGAIAFFAALRYSFSWWPLHPIGLAISNIWVIHWSAFSIFLAWAAKAVILRLGGIRTYQRAKPFFMGILVGYVLGVGASFLVDVCFFFGEGHTVHLW